MDNEIKDSFYMWYIIILEIIRSKNSSDNSFTFLFLKKKNVRKYMYLWDSIQGNKILYIADLM